MRAEVRAGLAFLYKIGRRWLGEGRNSGGGCGVRAEEHEGRGWVGGVGARRGKPVRGGIC
jgi:hypothetical protein